VVRLRGVGRVRARRLFNNSITSPDSVRAAGIDAVTRIIGRGIAEQIFSQLDDKKCTSPARTARDMNQRPPSSDENNKEGQSTLSHFR